MQQQSYGAGRPGELGKGCMKKNQNELSGVEMSRAHGTHSALASWGRIPGRARADELRNTVEEQSTFLANAGDR